MHRQRSLEKPTPPGPPHPVSALAEANVGRTIVRRNLDQWNSWKWVERLKYVRQNICRRLHALILHNYL